MEIDLKLLALIVTAALGVGMILGLVIAELRNMVLRGRERRAEILGIESIEIRAPRFYNSDN